MHEGLGDRERLLTIWVQDRLGERAAVEWATKALKRIRAEVGSGGTTMFKFLDKHANESAEFTPATKKVWRLFKIVAFERASKPSLFKLYEVERKIDQKSVRLCC